MQFKYRELPFLYIEVTSENHDYFYGGNTKGYCFDSGLSNYRIQLIESAKQEKYITIEHTVSSRFPQDQSIVRLRYGTLDLLMKALFEMYEVFPEPKKKSRIKPEYEAEIIRRYLNTGLEIETLAVQFACSVDELKAFLRKRGIVITGNSLAKNPVRRFWRRKKRTGR
jgi:hypothetical protein